MCVFWLSSCAAVLLPCIRRLVFVDIICTDEKIIASNVRETKLKSPDYKHMDEATAVCACCWLRLFLPLLDFVAGVCVCTRVATRSKTS
jgi:hypothetical protein